VKERKQSQTSSLSDQSFSDSKYPRYIISPIILPSEKNHETSVNV